MDKNIKIILFLMGIMVVYLAQDIYSCIRGGRVELGSRCFTWGTVYRNKEPFMFWFVTIFEILVLFICIFVEIIGWEKLYE